VGYGCEDDYIDVDTSETADIVLKESKRLEAIPKGLLNIVSEPNGRVKSIVTDIQDLTFVDEFNEESKIIGMEMEDEIENLTTTLYYNPNTASLTYRIEEIQLTNNEYQINYMSPDGMYIFMQLEGPKEKMQVTFMANEENSPIFLGEDNLIENGRIKNCSADGYVNGFTGCLGKLWEDTYFKGMLIAGTLAGYSGYIAAGAVIGCGIHASYPCLWDWTHSGRINNNESDFYDPMGGYNLRDHINGDGSYSDNFVSFNIVGL